jgi:hypothetical protein
MGRLAVNYFVGTFKESLDSNEETKARRTEPMLAGKKWEAGTRARVAESK